MMLSWISRIFRRLPNFLKIPDATVKSLSLFWCFSFSADHSTIMSDLHFIKSNRGGRLLVFNNFIYRKAKTSHISTYLRCSTASCKATLKTENDSLRKTPSVQHNHASHSKKIKRKIFYSNLKMDAGRNFNVPVPTLYKAHIAKARLDDEEASSYLPSFHTAKKIVYNSLKEGRPPMPRNLKDITLDGNWALTLDNKDFLLINDGDDDKILAFATLENLKLLCSSDKIFLDGTFKANPRMFKQLYTIHGKYCDQIFPLIFCLLPDKSQATYQRLFTNLKNIAMKKGIKFEVKNAMMDFESASMNAFESVFPQTALKGCFFHYTQCILRKVQNLGLKMLHQNDENVKKWVRRIMALPLIPTSQIADAFRFLQDEAPQNLIQKHKMHNYVMKTWLDANKPVFNISVWNHFENSSERTNNNVEGFHSMMNKRCRPHPNLFGCIEVIKNIQQENTVIMEMLSAGKIKPVQSQLKYRKINEKIAHLKDNLSQKRILLNAYIDEVGKLLHSED